MRRVGEKVPMDECIRRALTYGATLSLTDLAVASSYAEAIWPENKFLNTQGAALASGKILRTMINRGLLEWGVKSNGLHGYSLTSKGRAEAKKDSAVAKTKCGCCAALIEKDDDLFCHGCRKHICGNCSASTGPGHAPWAHKPCDVCGEAVEDPGMDLCARC